MTKKVIFLLLALHAIFTCSRAMQLKLLQTIAIPNETDYSMKDGPMALSDRCLAITQQKKPRLDTFGYRDLDYLFRHNPPPENHILLYAKQDNSLRFATRLDLEGAFVTSIKFSQDGRHLLIETLNDKLSLRIWDIDALEHGVIEPKKTPYAHQTEDLDNCAMSTLSPDGSLMASKSYDGTIKLWGKADNKWICTHIINGYLSHEVRSIGFILDGSLIIIEQSKILILKKQPDGTLKLLFYEQIIHDIARFIWAATVNPSGTLALRDIDEIRIYKIIPAPLEITWKNKPDCFIECED